MTDDEKDSLSKDEDFVVTVDLSKPRVITTPEEEKADMEWFLKNLHRVLGIKSEHTK